MKFSASSEICREEILSVQFLLGSIISASSETFIIVRSERLFCKREGAHIQLGIPCDFFKLSGNPLEELFRKFAMHLKQIHDVSSIDQNRAVHRENLLRQTIQSQLPFEKSGGKCRFILRTDDFPSPRAASADFKKFHEIAKKYRVPYLLAVTPFYENRSLTAEELSLLQSCSADGAEMGLHGFTHLKRIPTIASELHGMPASDLQKAIHRAKDFFHQHDWEASIFVPPFNSYDRSTLSLLSKKFSILCGGPESVSSVGYRILSFMDDSLYIPSYRGVYDIRPHHLKLIESFKHGAKHCLIPITIHWANEIKDQFANFEKLCQVIAGSTLPWSELLKIRNEILESSTRWMKS